MKRIPILLTLLPLIAAANPISEREAAVIAARYINTPTLVSNSNATKSRDGKQAGLPAWHLFNSADNSSFVIISGEDRLPSVIGYSTTNGISSDAMPPQLVFFLESYAQMVDDVRDGRVKAPIIVVDDDEDEDSVGVKPLITSQWNQGSPYNMSCPNEYPVGCVATAMAQVMYFWKYPAQGKGMVSNYNWGSGMISMDFSQSTYQWDVMKNKYSDIDRKKVAGQAVAKLSLDCGVATHMKYSATGSGTTMSEAYNALFTYFSYDAEAISYHRRSCYATQEEWDSLLICELDSGRPILMGAASPTGGGSDASGHAFVIDGYDSRRFAHVNWGWGGNYNGHFNFALLNGGNYVFSDGQEAIIGIKPDPDQTHTKRKQYRLLLNEGIQYAQGKVTEVSLPANIKIFADMVYNVAAIGGTYTVSAGLFDTKGNFVADLAANTPESHDLGSNYGFIVGMLGCKLTEDIPDGMYYISIVSKEKGYDQYVRTMTEGGDVNNAIPVYIHDGKAAFNQVVEETSLPGDINGDGSVNITDVVVTINLIAAGSYSSAADINADNAVNITDVVQIINIIAGI